MFFFSFWEAEMSITELCLYTYLHAEKAELNSHFLILNAATIRWKKSGRKKKMREGSKENDDDDEKIVNWK
jgi:hypothetical protein